MNILSRFSILFQYISLRKIKKLLYFKNKYNDFRVEIPVTERPEKYINLSKEPIINIRYPLSQKSR